MISAEDSQLWRTMRGRRHIEFSCKHVEVVVDTRGVKTLLEDDIRVYSPGLCSDCYRFRPTTRRLDLAADQDCQQLQYWIKGNDASPS